VLDWFFDENIQLKKNELPKQVHITITDTLEGLLAGMLVASSRVDDGFNILTDSDPSIVGSNNNNNKSAAEL